MAVLQAQAAGTDGRLAEVQRHRVAVGGIEGGSDGDGARGCAGRGVEKKSSDNSNKETERA